MILAIAVPPAAPMHAYDLEFRYSAIYDTQQECPGYKVRVPSERIRQEVARYRALWAREGAEIRGSIAKATGLDIPLQPTVVYVVACGRGISDPLTIPAFWTEGTPLSNREIHDLLRHELLHQAVERQPFAGIQDRVAAKYSTHESYAVINHVLVVGWEADIDGYGQIAWNYTMSPAYKRALEIAVTEGLTQGPLTK